MLRRRTERRSKHWLALSEVQAVEGRGCRGGSACLNQLRGGRRRVQRTVDLELENPKLRAAVAKQAEPVDRALQVGLHRTGTAHFRCQGHPGVPAPLGLDLIAGWVELKPHNDNVGQLVDAIQLDRYPWSHILFCRAPPRGKQAVHGPLGGESWRFAGSFCAPLQGQVDFRNARVGGRPCSCRCCGSCGCGRRRCGRGGRRSRGRCGHQEGRGGPGVRGRDGASRRSARGRSSCGRGRPVESPDLGQAVIHEGVVDVHEPRVGIRRIHERERTREQDRRPGIGRRQSQPRQDVVPLLGAELCRSRKEQSWRQRKHLNAMDVLIAPAEPSSIIDLVLKEDAGHMIRDKVRWVVNVV
mmetsp:Transcript_73933/g.176235  ORF Transcript_73933/g.176235 Transcript_73933/m.176235 type:complete len:355 (+) Transcript_73933:2149-3213(+)